MEFGPCNARAQQVFRHQRRTVDGFAERDVGLFAPTEGEQRERAAIVDIDQKVPRIALREFERVDVIGVPQMAVQAESSEIPWLSSGFRPGSHYPLDHFRPPVSW